MRTLAGYMGLLVLGFCVSSHSLIAQNTVMTYQGRVRTNGTNFFGLGQFKFALVTSSNANQSASATVILTAGQVSGINLIHQGNGYATVPDVRIVGGGGTGATATASLVSGQVANITVNNPGEGYTSTPTVLIDPPPANNSYQTFWSNDGTSVQGSEPVAVVYLPVDNGLFTVALGDTTLPNMLPIGSSLFAQPDLRLRIWFNDGVNGFAAVEPAQSLTPVPRALFASSSPGGAVTNSQYLPGTPSGNGQALTNLTGQNLQPGTVNSNAFDTATVRTLLAWTGNTYPVLNPKDFGAWCDGIHNDSAALSNTLFAASQSRGVVFIPKPGILCRDPIWMGGSQWGNVFPWSNPRITGADANTYLIFSPNAGAAGAFLTISNASIDIENLHVIGPGRTVGNWDGIVYTNTGGAFIFRNVTFRNWSGHPFFTEIRANIAMDGVYFANNAHGVVNGGYMDGGDWKTAFWGTDVAMDYSWDSSLGNSRGLANRLRLDTEYCTNGLVLGSGATAVDFSTYSENYYQSLLDIGHDPARMIDPAPPGLVWFHDSYGQGGQAPPQMVRLWTNAQALVLSRVSSESIVGAVTNSLIRSSNPAADNSPVAIENCSDGNQNLFRFSNGQVITGTPADRDYVNMPFRFFNKRQAGTNQLLALNDGDNALTLFNNVPINSDGTNVTSGGFAATGKGFSMTGQQGITAVLNVYGATNVLRLTVSGGIIVGASYAPLSAATQSGGAQGN